LYKTYINAIKDQNKEKAEHNKKYIYIHTHITITKTKMRNQREVLWDTIIV